MSVDGIGPQPPAGFHTTAVFVPAPLTQHHADAPRGSRRAEVVQVVAHWALAPSTIFTSGCSGTVAARRVRRVAPMRLCLSAPCVEPWAWGADLRLIVLFFLLSGPWRLSHPRALHLGTGQGSRRGIFSWLALVLVLGLSAVAICLETVAFCGSEDRGSFASWACGPGHR